VIEQKRNWNVLLLEVPELFVEGRRRCWRADEVIQECPPTTILIIFRLSTINLKNCHGINRLQNRV